MTDAATRQQLRQLRLDNMQLQENVREYQQAMDALVATHRQWVVRGACEPWPPDLASADADSCFEGVRRAHMHAHRPLGGTSKRPRCRRRSRSWSRSGCVFANGRAWRGVGTALTTVRGGPSTQAASKALAAYNVQLRERVAEMVTVMRTAAQAGDSEVLELQVRFCTLAAGGLLAHV